LGDELWQEKECGFHCQVGTKTLEIENQASIFEALSFQQQQDISFKKILKNNSTHDLWTSVCLEFYDLQFVILTIVSFVSIK